MANFEKILKDTIRREGGFVLHETPGDRGGQTYAGIARLRHPSWAGWRMIDNGRLEGIEPLVAAFYLARFWKPVQGDAIADDRIASASLSYQFTRMFTPDPMRTPVDTRGREGFHVRDAWPPRRGGV